MISKKSRNAAKGQPCIRCGKNEGTVCARHYNGTKQGFLGKGWAVKTNDLFMADLCDKCDAIFSEGVLTDDYESKTERDLHLMIYCALTIERRFEQGIFNE